MAGSNVLIFYTAVIWYRCKGARVCRHSFRTFFYFGIKLKFNSCPAREASIPDERRFIILASGMR